MATSKVQQATSKILQKTSRSLQLLSAILDCFPENIAVLDENGKVVIVNRAWVEFARANDMAFDQPWVGLDYLAACRGTEGEVSASVEEVGESLRAVLAGTQETMEIIYPCHGPDIKRWYRMRASGFTHGGARWAVVTHANVTDTRCTATAGKNRDLHYRNLVENAHTGVINSRLDGEITFANQAAATLYEFASPEAMQAESMLARWRYPARRQQFTALLQRQGYVDNYEMEAVTKTGKIVHVLFSATLHGDDISGMLMDITERKQAEVQIKAYQSRLKALAWQLTIAEERERRRLAMELHDQVGQSLAFMLMQLSVVQKASADRQEVAAILADVSATLRLTIQETRHVIADLSPPLMNEVGLAAALSDWLNEQIEKRYGLSVEFVDDGQPKPLGEETQAILFRNVRELLKNVLKYANASRVTVTLQRRVCFVQIVVEDNGVGFDARQQFSVNAERGGFGLFSIEERMTDLDGWFEIKSRPGQGVKAILTAPLDLG